MSAPCVNTKAEHEAALRRIEILWGSEPDTPEGEELEALLKAVERYEEAQYPI